jgi:hypothetical protein
VRDLLALHFDVSMDELGVVEIVPILDAALTEEVSRTGLPGSRLRGCARMPQRRRGSPLGT